MRISNLEPKRAGKSQPSRVHDHFEDSRGFAGYMLAEGPLVAWHGTPIAVHQYHRCAPALRTPSGARANTMADEEFNPIHMPAPRAGDDAAPAPASTSVRSNRRLHNRSKHPSARQATLLPYHHRTRTHARHNGAYLHRVYYRIPRAGHGS